MKQEEHDIDDLIERAAAGDEVACGIVLDMIEELLAQGIDLPASILQRLPLH